MEQRYKAVLEVRAGVPVVDVARRFGVSRQAVHRWKNRYRSGGLQALADRSKRPKCVPLAGAGGGGGVSASGNVKVGPRRFWIGPAHAGHRLGLWMDTTTVHLSLDEVHLKSVPSRQTTVSRTRLRSAGGRPAGPPPSRGIAVSRSGGTDDAAACVAVEVDRVVNASGLVGLAGRYVCVGQLLAGHRVTLRLDGDLAHVIDNGVLVRTLPAPVPPSLRRRLHGVSLAGPDRPVPAGPHGCSGGCPAAASPSSGGNGCRLATPTGTPSSTSTSTRPSSRSTARTANS
jgi:Helix-turn-helix domain